MSPATTILGLNAWHGDSSACLLVDGELVAAAEEERFRRLKHWAGFPSEAARWCLEQGGVDPCELDWIAVNRDPRVSFWRKAGFALRRRPSLGFLLDRRRNAKKLGGVDVELARSFGLRTKDLRARVARVEHHLAHLASSFLVSPFEEAAVVSVDGFGDFSSFAWGLGQGREIEVRDRVHFPHSLGLFYLAITQLLGFPRYGDEYKVMGLAAHGKPRFRGEMRRVLKLLPGRFELNLDCFVHHEGGAAMTWAGGEPQLGRVFGPGLERILGPARRTDEEIEDRHADLAASVQEAYEQALYHVLSHVARETGEERLCLAGGCAMNSLANGRITAETPFERLYVPPAPGDAGGAIGAAVAHWCAGLGRRRRFAMSSAYLGPEFREDDFEALLDEHGEALAAAGCTVQRTRDTATLCERVAARIAAGEVVGWFQGRMEWGPRALGNRSILADPRRADMRDLLNEKIKLRERFRPFAPAVRRDAVAGWFERDGDVPFMLQVWPIRRDRREQVPAVTHADGTGRLQTVSPETNPLFHELIEAFERETGVPILLNTSFNENEPVVCRPREALDCFLRTRMDSLVLGPWIVSRRERVARAA